MFEAAAASSKHYSHALNKSLNGTSTRGPYGRTWRSCSVACASCCRPAMLRDLAGCGTGRSFVLGISVVRLSRIWELSQGRH